METTTFIHPLLAALGRMSLQASALAVVVLIIQAVCGRRISAAWRHALWLPVVLRLLIPVGPESSWSLFNLAQLDWKSFATHGRRIVVQGNLGPLPVAAKSGVDSTAVEGAAMKLPVASPTWRERLPQIVLGVWVLGVAVLLLRILAGQLGFSRRVRRWKIVEDARVLALFEECKRELDVTHVVHLVEAEELESPALFGGFTTRLLLPRGLMAGFSEAELRHIFRHELAHVKRGDVWWNYAQTALQIVYWLNPLLWFVFSRIKSDRELACDALALSHTPGAEVQSYGETIIKLLERIQRPVALPGLVGISENKAQLKQRILMVAGFGKRRTSIWLPACLLVIVMLLGLSEAKGVGEKPAVPAVPKSTKVAAVAADAKPVEAVKPVKAVDPVPVAKPTPIVAPVQAAEPKSPATPVIPASKEVQIDPSTGIPVQVPASPVESDVQIDPNTGQPIKWPPGVPHEKLVTRFFKVDPNTFIQALNAFDGKSDKKLSDSDFDQPEILNRIRDVFAQAGAKLEATNTSKSLFYQRNKGVLLARATLPELAIIQGVLDVFNVAPPQVVLTAKIVEMVSDTRTLTNSEFLLSDANMPQGILSEEGKVAMIGTPLPAGFPTNARAVVVRAILNDASFHNLLQSLRGREGVNMLSTPNVTTLSGRQARISVLNDPTPVEARAGLPATGQIFDILPTVKPDGYTIHLQVGFTLVEKLPPAKTGFFSKSSKLPTIQRRELSTTATVRDGETIILTGLQTKEGKKTKSFAIFITPTIIDPAGNRIHSPAKLPFNPNVVPP